MYCTFQINNWICGFKIKGVCQEKCPELEGKHIKNGI